MMLARDTAIIAALVALLVGGIIAAVAWFHAIRQVVAFVVFTLLAACG